MTSKSKTTLSDRILRDNHKPLESRPDAPDAPDGDKLTNDPSDATEHLLDDSGASDAHVEEKRTPADIANLDPFDDLERLRLSQDFAAMSNVKPVLTTVSVRKPHKHEFIRVRPGREWRFETGCFVDKTDRNEVYLVAPEVWPALPGEVKPIVMLVAISRQSPVPFIWPCPLPGPDGRSNRWHESGLEVARLAEERWLRVVSDMTAGCYVPYVAEGNLAEPEWPDMELAELLRLAFRDRFIQDTDHPVIRRLRGEV